jgi:carboxyl-terminal processing protease
MKRYLIAIAPIFLLFGIQPEVSHLGSSVVMSAPVLSDDLKPTMSQEKVETYLTNIFQAYHFRKFRVNDSLSSQMFDNYLKEIDGSKLYFLNTDIQEFEKYRNQLDDHLNTGNLTAAYDIYNVFRKRYRERSAYIDKLLEQPKFDFTIDENFNTDREKIVWPKDNAEMNEVWRKLIKNEALELKLANKADTSIVKMLKDRYKSRERNLGRIKSEQVFQMYMNSFCEILDPHTRYLSPTETDRFRQDMSKSLDGIGAILREEGNYIKIVEVVAGGPAFKDKRLKVNDKIVAVAQGDNGTPEDIVGWYVDDAVKKIKGPKGTVVRLQVISEDDLPNTPPKEIRLVREKINIQDARTTKEIVTINHNKIDYKIGVINIPSFYRDFDAANSRSKDFNSTTRDVQKVLDTLKAANVDGVIIDLRNNGGGSLTEAINLTGLFINKGPVVQVKETRGEVEVYTDPDPSIYYDGPLAVMTNRFSASASEIFAAAIQDYKRGVIVGEQTYGKGTVQTQVDLNQIMSREQEKLGQVNITIQKFYRVNGSSTQRKGVTPDIEMPSPFKIDELREGSQPTALPWDQVVTARYEATKNLNEKQLGKLKDKFQYRLKNDTELKTFAEEQERLTKMRENRVVSLQETKRKKQAEEDEKRRKILEKVFMDNSETEEVATKDATPKKAVKKKRKDIYLIETERILADYIVLTKSANIAKR